MKRVVPYLLLAIGTASLVVTNILYSTPTFGVRTRIVELDSPSDIVPVSERYVKPYLYTHVDGLADMPVDKAKQSFIAAVLPAVLVAKHEIDMVKLRLKKLRQRDVWNAKDSAWFMAVRTRYKARDLDDLFMRVGSLPTSIVLAQAAVESGWGQSRFFLQANNLFGVWSFDPNEPRIMAGEGRGDRKIFLRSYGDMSESIVDYFGILASSGAYTRLRKARIEQNDPFKLLPYLSNYSERKHAYTRQLKTIILQNRLTVYDLYQIDPDYLYEE